MSKVANKDALSRATSGSVPSYIPVPTLRANKGLPLGLDVGLMFSKIPGSDISLWGGEARWAFIKGGIAAPAVGLRGTSTKLTGVEHLDKTTKGLHISPTNGLAILTPYVRLGRTRLDSNPPRAHLTNHAFPPHQL